MKIKQINAKRTLLIEPRTLKEIFSFEIFVFFTQKTESV